MTPTGTDEAGLLLAHRYIGHGCRATVTAGGRMEIVVATVVCIFAIGMWLVVLADIVWRWFA